jgi:hypothetical protein
MTATELHDYDLRDGSMRPEQWQNDIDEAFERVMKATGRMDQA